MYCKSGLVAFRRVLLVYSSRLRADEVWLEFMETGPSANTRNRASRRAAGDTQRWANARVSGPQAAQLLRTVAAGAPRPSTDFGVLSGGELGVIGRLRFRTRPPIVVTQHKLTRDVADR